MLRAAGLAVAVATTAGLCQHAVAEEPAPPVIVEASPQPPPGQGPTAQTMTQSSPAEPGPGPDTGLPHDLSPWGMFLAADRVVKAVMIGLAVASLLTWTVWLAKSLELAAAGRGLRRAGAAILAAGSLDQARAGSDGVRGVAGALVMAASEEMRLSAGAPSGTGVKERVGSRLARLQARAASRLSRGTGVLATIGSTAPFVGLFGTVWGIMNAFVGISRAHTTNLAVVAPGIAEALLATALGLVVAIPAVVFYNIFARALAAYRQDLADIAAGVERLVSRDLDLSGGAG